MATLVVYKADPYADHTFKKPPPSPPRHFFMMTERSSSSPEAFTPASFFAPDVPDGGPEHASSLNAPSFSWSYGDANTSEHQNDEVAGAFPTHTNATHHSHTEVNDLESTFQHLPMATSGPPPLFQPFPQVPSLWYGHMTVPVGPFAPGVNSAMQHSLQQHPQQHLPLDHEAHFNRLLEYYNDVCQCRGEQPSPHLHPSSFHPALPSPPPRATFNDAQMYHEIGQDFGNVYDQRYVQVHRRGQLVPLCTAPDRSATGETLNPQTTTSCDSSSLYAPARFPSVMCLGQEQQQQQQQQPENRMGEPQVTSSLVATTWSPTVSHGSLASTEFTESAAQRAAADNTLETTVNPPVLSHRVSTPSAVGSSLRDAALRQTTHKISKGTQRTTPTTLARTLPTWLENHEEVVPALNPSARRSMSIMFPVPEPDSLIPSTAPLSLATTSIQPDTPPRPLDIEGPHPGMRVVPSGEEVGIAPSLIFGKQSHDGMASTENIDVTPPFMGEQFDDGRQESSSSDRGTSFLARESDAGFLEVSESGNDSIRSSSRQSIASARASPLPGQHAESIPAAPKQPRVKLPRPSPTPMFSASEAAWESGEEEAEDGEQVEESSSQHGLPEVERQVTGVSTVGTDSEALRRQQAERSRQDAFLVAQRRAGLTYREIRRLGGFEEAESTLRGRFRTLTKPKEERVRRPRWSEGDDQLLVSAVRRLARGGLPAVGDEAPLRISWKAVSDFIAEHGGSYKFGNTTCHKRWTHLRSKGLV